MTSVWSDSRFACLSSSQPKVYLFREEVAWGGSGGAGLGRGSGGLEGSGRLFPGPWNVELAQGVSSRSGLLTDPESPEALAFHAGGINLVDPCPLAQVRACDNLHMWSQHRRVRPMQAIQIQPDQHTDI